MSKRSQCLIFLVQEEQTNDERGSRSSSSQVGIKGYVLLPRVYQDRWPKVTELFWQNSLRVINDDDTYPSLKNVSLELIEVLLDDNLSDILSVYSEEDNEKEVGLLLSRNVVVRSVPKLDTGGKEDDNCTKPKDKDVYSVSSSDEDECWPLPFELGREKLERWFGDNFSLKNFHLAVGDGNMKVTKHLLSHQADVRYRNAKGGTILHMAVQRGNTALVELLLSCGASVDSERNDNSTSLHIAVKKNSIRMTKLLVQRGAKVDSKMHDGTTPLFLAVSKHDRSIVAYLLSSGVDVYSVCPVRVDEFKLDALLLPHPHSHYKLRDATSLHCAIKNCNVEIARILLQHGANVDTACEDERGWSQTCLQLAVDSGMCELVQAVLNHHPNINNENNKKSFVAAIVDGSQDCKHTALERERYKAFNEEVVHKMFQYGFRVSPEDANDVNLLFAAVESNCIGVVRQLLEYGAAKLAEGNILNGQILNAAVLCCDENMVELLLDFGLSVNGDYKNPLKTPLLFAADSGKLKTVQVLLARGVRVFQNLTEESNRTQYQLMLSACKSCEILELVLKYGADVGACCDGKTVLHLASWDYQVMETILKFGTVVGFAGEKDEPLHTAVALKRLKVFQLLLNYCFLDWKLPENFPSTDELSPEDAAGLKNIVSRFLVKSACVFSRESSEFIHLPEFRTSCLEEIERLKCAKVGGSKLSFHDFILGKVHLMLSFAKNENVVTTMLSEQFLKEFPIYGDVIKWRFWRGYYRRKLLERGIKVCLVLSKQFSALSDAYILLEKILSYLSNKELLCLISDRSIISEPLF